MTSMIYHTQPPASQKEGHLNATCALKLHCLPTIKHQNTELHTYTQRFSYIKMHTEYTGAHKGSAHIET